MPAVQQTKASVPVPLQIPVQAVSKTSLACEPCSDPIERLRNPEVRNAIRNHAWGIFDVRVSGVTTVKNGLRMVLHPELTLPRLVRSIEQRDDVKRLIQT